MIITYDALVGCVNIIVFQLTLWIGMIMKFVQDVYGARKNMLAFSFLAIPTRHEVPHRL